METTDLRRNISLVQDRTGAICKVDEINDSGQIRAWPVNGSGNVSLPFKGIELTDEIMNLISNSLTPVGYKINLGNGENTDYLFFKDGLIYMRLGRVLPHVNISLSHIKKLHELQNLYKSLKGSELNINGLTKKQ